MFTVTVKDKNFGDEFFEKNVVRFEIAPEDNRLRVWEQRKVRNKLVTVVSSFFPDDWLTIEATNNYHAEKSDS